MPDLKVVTDVDAQVHAQEQRTIEALAGIAEQGDRGVTPREMCDQFLCATKKKALRVIDAVLDQEDGVSAVSIHAVKKDGDDALKILVKVWKDGSPALYAQPEEIRARVLWAAGLGVEYHGWSTPIVNGG